MTIDAGQEEFPPICPYLGLADDADSHATYATDAHRCYRLPNPTRIATGHQDTYCLQAAHNTCPVFLGEAGAQTAPATAAPVAPPAGRATAAATRGTQPLGGARPRAAGGAGAAATGGAQRPRRDRAAASGSLNPRPRAGGISMPVATIGLFAMAVVVIVVAILIQQAVGGGGDDKTLSPADVTGTQAALRAQTRPPSAQAGTPQPGQTQQAGTPNPNQTPGPGTPVVTRTGTPGTPATTGQTYTVKSGDTCLAIAAASNLKLQELLDANKMTEDDCKLLQIGQVLKLP